MIYGISLHETLIWIPLLHWIWQANYQKPNKTLSRWSPVSKGMCCLLAPSFVIADSNGQVNGSWSCIGLQKDIIWTEMCNVLYCNWVWCLIFIFFRLSPNLFVWIEEMEITFKCSMGFTKLELLSNIPRAGGMDPRNLLFLGFTATVHQPYPKTEVISLCESADIHCIEVQVELPQIIWLSDDTFLKSAMQISDASQKLCCGCRQNEKEMLYYTCPLETTTLLSNCTNGRWTFYSVCSLAW